MFTIARQCQETACPFVDTGSNRSTRGGAIHTHTQIIFLFILISKSYCAFMYSFNIKTHTLD